MPDEHEPESETETETEPEHDEPQFEILDCSGDVVAKAPTKQEALQRKEVLTTELHWGRPYTVRRR